MAWVTVSSIFQGVRRVEEPSSEPVSLGEMKTHLRIMPDFNEDDLYLMGLISAARRFTENRTRRTFMATRWKATFKRWDYGKGADLPYPPAIGDAGREPLVGYINRDGVKMPLPVSSVELDTDAFPARACLLETLETRSGLQEGSIEWWAGVDDPAEVPQQAKVAIMMLVAHWYANREAVSSDGAGLQMPLGYDSLCASLSWDGGF